MQTLALNNDVTMPALGFGVFQTPPEETAASVEAALGVGYRLIDTAASSGNERKVGHGIRRSGVAGEEVFIETKADPASADAEPLRPHPRRLPGPGGTAGRRQGAGDRCQQFHAQTPRPTARRGDGDSAVNQRSIRTFSSPSCSACTPSRAS
jgi:aryl-alcohol dehydrogenase-like predicted oxidoreductase